ncbi:MAG: hypothetical protein K2N77_04450, partial [Lachnospiraceae bacterium]|nr:hypothetical protein [Lachnospiraceae bacterium]
AVGIEPSYEVEIQVCLEKADLQTAAGAETQEAAADADKQTATERADAQTDGQTRMQVISESDCAYGTWAFYAAEPETGRVGFAREGRTYTWDYVLPRGRQVELRVVGELGQTTLYADGVKIGTLGSAEPFEEYATFVFPIQRIGEETGSFLGEVEVERLR